MTQKKRQVSILILILLFAFNYASNNLFLHTHIIDGVKIAHSHPYSADSHQHSRASLDFISQASRLSYIMLTLIAVLAAVLTITYTITGRVNIVMSDFLVIHQIPRAPPI